MAFFQILFGLAALVIVVTTIRNARRGILPPHGLPPVTGGDTDLHQHQAIHDQHLAIHQAAHQQHMDAHHQAHQAALDTTTHTTSGCCDAGGTHHHH